MGKNRNRTTVPPQQGTNVSNYEQPAVDTTAPAPEFTVISREGQFSIETKDGTLLAIGDLTDAHRAAIAQAQAEQVVKTAPVDPVTKGQVVDAEAAVANIRAAQEVLKEVVVETKPPVEIPLGFAQPTPVMVDPHQLPLSASASSRLTIEELKDYIAKMSSRVRISTEQGGQVQSHLYHTLIQAINTRPEDFDVTFGLAMRLIRENLSGVFSMENVHRYTPHATLPAKSMAHFRYLLSVLTGLADPSLRNESLRQTNLDKAFRSFNIKEEARQRVLNFFNV